MNTACRCRLLLPPLDRLRPAYHCTILVVCHHTRGTSRRTVGQTDIALRNGPRRYTEERSLQSVRTSAEPRPYINSYRPRAHDAHLSHASILRRPINFSFFVVVLLFRRSHGRRLDGNGGRTTAPIAEPLGPRLLWTRPRVRNMRRRRRTTRFHVLMHGRSRLHLCCNTAAGVSSDGLDSVSSASASSCEITFVQPKNHVHDCSSVLASAAFGSLISRSYCNCTDATRTPQECTRLSDDDGDSRALLHRRT